MVRSACALAILAVLNLPVDGYSQQNSNPFFLDFQPKEATIPEYQAYDKPDLNPTVTVRVAAADTLARVPRYIYGNNINPYIGDIHQEDKLIDHVTQLSPHVLRLPGGNLSNVFFWDASPGNLPPGVPDSLVDGNTGEKYDFTPWYGRGSWSLEIDGFYAFIEKTNSTPVISVNYSYARYGKTENPVQQAAHYAAEWVRYDNGRTKFWEIGNENYGPWQAGYLIDTTSNQDGQPHRINGSVYGRHAKVFIDSMRAAAADVGAEIYIGTQVNVQQQPNWETSVVKNWNSLYFEEAGNVADFFIEHNYFTDFETDAPPSHIFSSVDRQFGGVADYYPEQIEAHGVEAKPIAMTEWNIFSTGSKQQVSNVSGMHATMVLGRLAETPYYGLSARWNVANGYDGGNDHGTFKREESSQPPVGVPQWNPRPDFFHMYYFQKVFGDHSVRTEITQGDGVEAYASTFSSGEAGIVVVNTTTARQTINIAPEDFKVGDRYYFYSLVGGEDNPPFSGRVFVNGAAPDHATGGPAGEVGTIAAHSAPAEGGIRFNAPPRSVQYVLVSGRTDTTASGAPAEPPAQFELQSNYPNPFHSSTQIQYALKETAHVTISVYNVLGQKVATLVDREQDADTYQVRWDGRNDQGIPVGSGVYFYNMQAGNYSKVRKMTLVR